MVSSSAPFTSGCAAGSSLNQRLQKTHQTTPIAPNTTNAARQPTAAINSTISGGASAPPSRVPMKMTPCALPRSAVGNQLEKLLEMLGNAPASPTPNRNRTTSSETKFQAAPVSIVNADHQRTMRVSTRRGPVTSPSHPLGISNAAYANVKTLNTQPI